MSGPPAPEPFDVSVLGAADHLWVSVSSHQGSVFGVPRPMPCWDLPGVATPVAWMSDAVQYARHDVGGLAGRIGQELASLVFGVPEIDTLFHHTRGVAGRAGGQVLLRILAAPPSVGSWPWELMRDPQRPDSALGLARDVLLVRAGRSRTYATRTGRIDPPLHLLLVMSSPIADAAAGAVAPTPFDLYQEKRALLAELAPLVDRGLLRVDVEDRPSVERLRARIGSRRRGYHLVHYLGHARPDGLELEHDRNGLRRPVRSAEFARLLQQIPDLRLAVFAGCETARAPDDPVVAGQWPGPQSTADHCVRDAAPMVVGMQVVLPFSVERLLTRYFYQALVGGQPVAEALRLARLAIAGDTEVGGDLLNWAVPSLVLGGAEQGPLVDPEAKAVPPPMRPRLSLRLGMRQGELRFISRIRELRVALDVLDVRDTRRGGGARLLVVLGHERSGKTSFLDRVLDEIDDREVAVLFVSARRLLDAPDPVRELGALVSERIRVARGRAATARRLAPDDWWERLLEDLVDLPLVLAVDDGDLLRTAEGGPRLAGKLGLLAARRNRARLVVAATEELPALTEGLAGPQIRTIRLRPLAWEDVWAWVQRNLPVLARQSETTLAPFYADLPRLEQWEELADLLTARPTARPEDLPAMVRSLGTRVDTVTTGTGATSPPVFSAADPAATAADRPVPHDGDAPLASPVGAPVERGAIRVAVAGPFLVGREEEFARGVTRLAAEHRVAGRVASVGADHTQPLAELLPGLSPFGADGSADESDLLRWLEDVGARADVILMDFGGRLDETRTVPQVWERVVTDLFAQGRLVIAAAGNDGRPTYPAFCARALAVAAMDPQGAPRGDFAREPDLDKPELFAPDDLDGTALAGMLPAPGMHGSSFAALSVAVAAVLLWATDPGLPPTDIRKALIETACPVATGSGVVRRLDLAAGLRRIRRQILLDALEWGRLGLDEVLVESGMRSEYAVELLGGLVTAGEIRQVTQDGRERYENPRAIHLSYERLRQSPPGAERSREQEALITRARRLAGRGRYSSGAVTALWDSGREGRRIVALGAVQARPELGSVDIVADGIAAPMSRFEQRQALLAATALVDDLDPPGRARLRAALDTATGPDGDIGTDTARSSLTATLRTRLVDAPAPVAAAQGR